MSFAYNANILADQSTGEIMDHAMSLLDYLDLKRDGIQVYPGRISKLGSILTNFRVRDLSSSLLTVSGASLSSRYFSFTG